MVRLVAPEQPVPHASYRPQFRTIDNPPAHGCLWQGLRPIRTRDQIGSQDLSQAEDHPHPSSLWHRIALIMDRLSKEQRSWNMSRIKGANTTPELLVRSVLHHSGYRFRLHRRDLPGRPDIVLPKHNIVVFVHGCFWHRHEQCINAVMPKTRTEFWRQKFEDNTRRDHQALSQLTELGWRVLVIWECQTKNILTLAELLKTEIPAPPDIRTETDQPPAGIENRRPGCDGKPRSRKPSHKAQQTSSSR